MERHSDIQKFLEKVFPSEEARKAAGVCPFCGLEIGEFWDELSKKEFGISGLCQGCQDETFKPPDGGFSDDGF